MLRDERESRARRQVLQEGPGGEKEVASETEKKVKTGSVIEGSYKCGGWVEDYSNHGVYARELAREFDELKMVFDPQFRFYDLLKKVMANGLAQSERLDFAGKEVVVKEEERGEMKKVQGIGETEKGTGTEEKQVVVVEDEEEKERER